MKLYAILLAYVSLVGLTQPYAIAAEVAADSWLDPWRQATVAVGSKKHVKIKDLTGKESEKEIFVVNGAGVIFGLPGQTTGVPWLVTAKHVLYNPDTKWEPESVQIRFAWYDDRPVDDYFGLMVRLRKDGSPLWIESEETGDLAAVPLRFSKKEAGKETLNAILPDKDFARAEEIFEGAGVLVLGYPAAIGLEFWTRALLRGGIIAWANPRDPLRGPLLIDVAIFPGNSGGPVFRQPSGIKRDGNFQLGGQFSFLGIVSQGRKQSMPLIAGGKTIELQSPDGAKQIISENWMGIGLVESAWKVRRLLEKAAARQ